MRRAFERTIKDDRGATCLLSRWQYKGRYPAPWHPIYSRTPRVWRRVQTIGYFAFIPVFGVMLAGNTLAGTSAGHFADVIVVAALLVLVPFALVSIYFHFKVFRPWVEQYNSGQGRCRACDYTLTDIPQDPDGCTTCPECGAAWKLPPSTPDA